MHAVCCAWRLLEPSNVSVLDAPAIGPDVLATVLGLAQALFDPPGFLAGLEADKRLPVRLARARLLPGPPAAQTRIAG